MRRSIFSLTLGIFCAALVVSAISVYLFRDVDQEMRGRWNEAFVQSCGESVLFALIVEGQQGF